MPLRRAASNLSLYSLGSRLHAAVSPAFTDPIDALHLNNDIIAHMKGSLSVLGSSQTVVDPSPFQACLRD
jgi:hypothetical protein